MPSVSAPAPTAKAISRFSVLRRSRSRCVQQALFLGQTRSHLGADRSHLLAAAQQSGHRLGRADHGRGIAAHRRLKALGAGLQQFLQPVGAGLLGRDCRR